jgi:receptor-type tyrosine-protein phosphatase beta
MKNCWLISQAFVSNSTVISDPESITKINATYISDREITLQWDTPTGYYDAFEVQYINADEHLVIHLALQPSITITGLKPFKNYTFTVLVESGRDTDVPRKSIPVSAVFTTKESRPGKIQFFNPIEFSLNNITFEWTLSEGLHNGILTEYVIKYGVKDEPLNANQSFGPNESRGTIKGLRAGVWYVFSIEAHTQIGAGEPSMLTKKMRIISPSPDIRPMEDGKTSTSITIKFRDNFFSHKNGEIKMYTIIVSEDYYDTNNNPDRPRSWADVQSLDRWPAYMV